MSPQKKGAAGNEANRQAGLARSELVLDLIAQGASYEQLAEALGVTYGSARTIVWRARKRHGVPALRGNALRASDDVAPSLSRS